MTKLVNVKNFNKSSILNNLTNIIHPIQNYISKPKPNLKISLRVLRKKKKDVLFSIDARLTSITILFVQKNMLKQMTVPRLYN